MEFQKLSPEQIDKIREILDLNNLVFEDIKLEITDHIACETETIMAEKNLLFGDALRIAFENWKTELQPSSGSFWVSRNIIAPRLVILQMAERSKKLMFKVFLVSMLSLIIFWSLIVNNQEELVKNYFNILVLYSILIFAGLLLFSRILILKSKIKTSFGFMFNRNCIMCLVFLFQISIAETNFKHFNFYEVNDFLLLFFKLFILSYSFLSLQLCFQHFKFISKIKL